MEEGVIIAAREVIGDYLSKIRQEKKVSRYRIMQKTGLSMNIINSIEKGSKSYTIDSLFKYTQAIGAYLFFGDKSGKKNTDNLIDEQDMLNQMKKNDPLK